MVLIKYSGKYVKIYFNMKITYLHTLAVSPSLGGRRQHKRTMKTMGFYSVLLAMTRDPAEFGWHCWSNTAHPPTSSTTYVTS